MITLIFTAVITIICNLAVGTAPDWGSAWDIAIAVEIIAEITIPIALMFIGGHKPKHTNKSTECNQLIVSPQTSDTLPIEASVTWAEDYSEYINTGRNPFVEKTVRYNCWEKYYGSNK